jgi:hypothetical protein
MVQPVGKSWGKWRRMTGKMVRSGSFIWISNDWRKVSVERKEFFYDALMVSVMWMLCVYYKYSIYIIYSVKIISEANFNYGDEDINLLIVN